MCCAVTARSRARLSPELISVVSPLPSSDARLSVDGSRI